MYKFKFKIMAFNMFATEAYLGDSSQTVFFYGV